MKKLERIALNQEALTKARKEINYILMLFALFLVVFKIIFFKENFIFVLKSVFAIFWLFLIPGYFVMLYWENKLNLIERIVLGVALSAALIGIFSYYLGIIGINIQIHTIILPLVLIIIGALLFYKKI